MAVKKRIFTLLFLALLAFKVSAAALHIHLHHDHHEEGHTEDCPLCDQALYAQCLEFSAETQVQIQEPPAVVLAVQPQDPYKSVLVITPIHSTHFGRPPPYIA